MNSKKPIITDQIEHWLSERHKFNKTYVGLKLKEIDFSREAPSLPQEIAEIINMACFLTRYIIDIELIFDEFDDDYYKLESILIFLYSIQARVVNENYLLNFNVIIPQVIDCPPLLTRFEYDAIFEHKYFNLDGIKNIPENFSIYVLSPFEAIPPNNYIPENEPKVTLKFRSLEESVLGGTFDHLHSGHKIFLTAAVLLTKGKITIGITCGSDLLGNKKYGHAMESIYTRKRNIKKFIKRLDPNKELNIIEITDPYGPTIYPEINATNIVTKETIAGSEAINKIRKEKGLKKLDVIIVGVLGVTLQTKLSSTGFRDMISCKIVGSEQILKDLHDDWVTLMKELNINYEKHQEFIEIWFDKLKILHCEPWRHYHTLNHIENLYKGWNSIKNGHINKKIIELCIWFHNSIFIAQVKDNKQKSIEFFKKWYTEGQKIKEFNLTQNEADQIEEVIIYSENYLTRNEKIDVLKEAQVFLDLDLAILGAPTNIYQDYANAIRKEYIHIPIKKFNEKRVTYLETFLKENKSIYRTSAFKELFEAQALENIKTEIETLSNKE